jgi:SAM-dependent methyltransferase
VTSSAYSNSDHEVRTEDPYALEKYVITLRWLRQRDAGPSLFNIGCGSGVFNQMAVDAGYTVEAYEPDPDAYALAARARPPTGCSVHNVALGDIPGSHVADVVVMHDVLEHLPDDAPAVDRLHDLLRPGGVLILSVPAMPSLFGYHDEQLGHYRRYTKTRLRAVIERRFDVQRLHAFGLGFVPVAFYYSRWRRKPYPVTVAGGRHVVGHAVRFACSLEGRIPPPVGTSLLCLAVPR